MKYRTEIVREGELLGPVDPTYDVHQHACIRQESCERGLALVLEAERLLAEGAEVWIETSYQFSHRVGSVGMYDGWPFWKPTPAVRHFGPIGMDWAFFYNVTRVFTKDEPVSCASRVGAGE